MLSRLEWRILICIVAICVFLMSNPPSGLPNFRRGRYWVVWQEQTWVICAAPIQACRSRLFLEIYS